MKVILSIKDDKTQFTGKMSEEKNIIHNASLYWLVYVEMHDRYFLD